jgi:hypothetical protein
MQKKKNPGPAATGSRANHASPDFYFPDFFSEKEDEFLWIHVGPKGNERCLLRKPKRTKVLKVWRSEGFEWTITSNGGRYRDGKQLVFRPPGRDWEYRSPYTEIHTLWRRPRLPEGGV